MKQTQFLSKLELNEIYDILIEPLPVHALNCQEDSFEAGWKEAVDVFMLEIESKLRERD